MPTRVIAIHEAAYDIYPDDNAELVFQWCEYRHTDGPRQWSEYGYRFMWRVNGRLKSQRGQARIPSHKILNALIAQAQQEGWGNLDESEDTDLN